MLNAVNSVYGVLGSRLSQKMADIEEGKSKYRPGGFHPVYIGDVYNDRYKVVNKIGYGVYSTVWLVKDLKQE